MPGMSGVQLQDQLRDQGYRVPFIFFTAFPDENIRARALAAGAICYLTKPFDGDSLIQCLQAASNTYDGGAENWDPPCSGPAKQSAARLNQGIEAPNHFGSRTELGRNGAIHLERTRLERWCFVNASTERQTHSNSERSMVGATNFVGQPDGLRRHIVEASQCPTSTVQRARGQSINL
jgi:DNA-binding response OmpR family regulator